MCVIKFGVRIFEFKIKYELNISLYMFRSNINFLNKGFLDK